MRVHLAYSREGLSVDLPEGYEYQVLECPPLPAAADPVAAAQAAGATLPDPDQAARLAAAAAFRETRQDLQATQAARLAAGLPLPQLLLPYQFSAELGPEQLGVLSEALGSAIDALAAEDAA